nr:hypothetical protein GCM10020093_045520 [Planobispora longispora]
MAVTVLISMPANLALAWHRTAGTLPNHHSFDVVAVAERPEGRGLADPQVLELAIGAALPAHRERG